MSAQSQTGKHCKTDLVVEERHRVRLQAPKHEHDHHTNTHLVVGARVGHGKHGRQQQLPKRRHDLPVPVAAAVVYDIGREVVRFSECQVL